MSYALRRQAPERMSTAAYTRLADHSLTARQMAEHLGKMALSLAIDRHAQAGVVGDKAATGFWGRVCEELADMAIPVVPSRD